MSSMTTQAKAKDVRFTFEDDICACGGVFMSRKKRPLLGNTDSTKQVYVTSDRTFFLIDYANVEPNQKGAITGSIKNLIKTVESLAEIYSKYSDEILAEIKGKVPQIGLDDILKDSSETGREVQVGLESALTVGDIIKINEIMISHFVGR